MIDTQNFYRRNGIAEQDYRLVLRLPMFAGLKPEGARSLLAHGRVQSVPRNAVLFVQDEPALRFYVVFEGWVKLTRTSEDGHEAVIGVFTRGESFAEAAMFDKGLFPVTATAVEESRLLVIPAEPFIRRLSEDGALALTVLASMSRHLRALVHQVERLAMKSTTERVAEFLLKLAAAPVGPAMVRLPLDKALIAGRLGMQPESFSRSLAKLRLLGVTIKGAEISIADIGILRRASENGRTRRKVG